jgi:hypothetical protein
MGKAYIWIFLTYLFCAAAFPQTKFAALYEAAFGFSKWQQMLPGIEKVDTMTRVQMVVTSTGTKTTLKSFSNLPLLKSSGGAELLLKDNIWVYYDPRTRKYEKGIEKPIKVLFTGAVKNILGYKSSEARGKNYMGHNVTVWICKSLPSTMLPGVSIVGSPGAVLEFHDEEGGINIVIKSLKI